MQTRVEHDPNVTAFLFEHARDIILVIDAELGTIIDANLAAERAYGYARRELLAMTIFDLREDPKAPVSAQMRTANAAGIQFETVHRRKDGSRIPVEVSSRGETISGRRCLLSIVRDISDRKRQEADRDALLAATQRALALRDDFLMIASHELRAPLTNVSLQLQTLQRLVDRGGAGAQLRQSSSAALREAGRLTTLIDALLDAQARKGQLALGRVDVDLRELVADVVERIRVRAAEIGSSLEVDVPALRGRWDRLRVEQVLMNVIANAIKFGRARPVRISAVGEEAYVRIDVVDQGIGIASDDVERIFGKFERAVPSSYGGFGLGLFIARQIVEAHGGRIAVQSVPGDGSTFSVYLPR